MRKTLLLSTLLTLLLFNIGRSQTIQDSKIVVASNELKGFVLDIDNHASLPYANIFVLCKNIGAVSNERGYFSIDRSGLEKTDTIRFQYIGYKTRKITIGQLDTLKVVYLKEDIINLTETLIFGSAPNAKFIVKKVLQFRDSNYKRTTTKNLTFIRKRNITEFENFKLDLKKTSISQLDEELIKLVENKIPKEAISYNDFLGNVYHSKIKRDSATVKTDPIRAVSLKEKDIAELDYIESVFEEVFEDIGEEQYWKVKSGIFSQKIDDEEDETTNDTLNVDAEQMKDSIKESGRNLYYYSRSIKNRLNYSYLNDKDSWEFLHKTSKYNYSLEGGTRVNGEDVYIIEFTPKSSGKFIGKLYIATATYALIRADYEFAEGKIGRDFHLFGIGYTENLFCGSIYFERQDDNYVLKYMSKKTGFTASFDRSIALVKKEKRFLFDKKINELKVGIDLTMRNEDSFEYLVIDKTQISEEQFSDFTEEERMAVIYVEQFDDDLWKGYPIIEPTKRMREYKKQEVVYSE